MARRFADFARVMLRWLRAFVAALSSPAVIVAWLTLAATFLMVSGVFTLFGLGPALLCAAAALYAIAAILARGVIGG